MNANCYVFLWGMAGASLDLLFHWAAIKHDVRFPTYAKTWKYWIVSILLVLMGGLVTLAYAKSVDGMIKPITQMTIGFSGTSLIKKLSKAFNPEVPVAGGGTRLTVSRPSIKTFLNQ